MIAAVINYDFTLLPFLQYVNGGSLDQIIISGSRPSEEFPWSDRVSMANDINEGLTYLHSRGIFHRDLTSKVIIQYNSKLHRVHA